MIKDLVLEVTQELSDNATLEEILDAIIVRLSAEKGIQDIADGHFTTQEDLLKEIEIW